MDLIKYITMTTTFILMIIHISTCLMKGTIFLMFLGGLFFPIGIIHGAYIVSTWF